MNKRLIAVGIIVLLTLLFITPLPQSVATQTIYQKYPIPPHPAGEFKIQRVFLFAQVQGTAEITGSFYAQELFKDPRGGTIYRRVILDGTVISENLDFFTIWSPFAFLPWVLWDGLPIYLQIRFFTGFIEHNETQNTVRLFGTGTFIHLVTYIDVPWDA